MISYLGSARSVQSCCGEGGALQAVVAVCGEHSPCSGQAATASGLGSQRFACALPGRGAPFPSAAPAPAAAGRVSGSLQIGTGPSSKFLNSEVKLLLKQKHRLFFFSIWTGLTLRNSTVDQLTMDLRM